MRVASFATFSAVLVSLAGGCVGDAPTGGDAGKVTGDEGGPCFSDFTCKTGLVCNLGPNTCVKPGTDGAVVDTGTGDVMMPSDGADSGPACIPTAVAWFKGENSTQDELMMHNATGMNVFFTQNGKVGRAFDFSSGHLTVPLAQSAPQSQMSLDFWIRISSAAAFTQFVLMARDAGGGKVWTVQLASGSKILTFGAGGGMQANATLTQNAYTHVAFVYDAGRLYSYVNGVVESNGVLSATTQVSAAQNVYVGADDDNTSSFVGQVDELAIYRSALTQPQAKTIFDADAMGICRQ